MFTRERDDLPDYKRYKRPRNEAVFRFSVFLLSAGRPFGVGCEMCQRCDLAEVGMTSGVSASTTRPNFLRSGRALFFSV